MNNVNGTLFRMTMTHNHKKIKRSSRILFKGYLTAMTPKATKENINIIHNHFNHSFISTNF